MSEKEIEAVTERDIVVITLAQIIKLAEIEIDFWEEDISCPALDKELSIWFMMDDELLKEAGERLVEQGHYKYEKFAYTPIDKTNKTSTILRRTGDQLIRFGEKMKRDGEGVNE